VFFSVQACEEDSLSGPVVAGLETSSLVNGWLLFMPFFPLAFSYSVFNGQFSSILQAALLTSSNTLVMECAYPRSSPFHDKWIRNNCGQTTGPHLGKP